MPEPVKGEKLSGYMKKFMSAPEDQKWPQKQRAAIAYSEFRKKGKKKAKD